eukprot:6181393-Pleurochrysis_carterae.AAC.4
MNALLDSCRGESLQKESMQAQVRSERMKPSRSGHNRGHQGQYMEHAAEITRHLHCFQYTMASQTMSDDESCCRSKDSSLGPRPDYAPENSCSMSYLMGVHCGTSGSLA